MKKNQFTAVIVFLFFCLSCGNEKSGSLSATAQKNLDIDHAITKAIESGDISTLDNYIAADAVDHSGPNGDVKGLDNIKAALGGYSKMMSNMKSEIIKQFADDETVMTWVRQTGVMNEAAMGFPKGPYDMKVIEIAKYKDGKATEHWTYMDGAEMMKMMTTGQPAAMPPVDTTKAK